VSLRRFAVAAALACAAALVATPALAAYPDESTLQCSVQQTLPETTFTCTVTRTQGDMTFARLTGLFPRESAPRELGVLPLDANGQATFTIPAGSDFGAIDFASFLSDSAAGPWESSINPAQVMVVAVLAQTGVDGKPMALIAGGVLLVGAGAIVLVAARRRRSQAE